MCRSFSTVTAPFTITYRMPAGILVRVLERRPVDDTGRVEDRDVGPQPFPEMPAIRDPELVRVHAGHLPDGFRQGQHLELTDVTPEDARERPVVARAGMRAPGRPIVSHLFLIGPDRRPGLLHHELHVRLRVMEEHRGHAAVLLDQHIEEHLHRIAASRLDQLAHAPALERLVAIVAQRDEQHAAPAVSGREVVVNQLGR